MLQGLLNGLLYTLIGSIIIFTMLYLLVLFIRGMVKLDARLALPSKKKEDERLDYNNIQPAALPAPNSGGELDPKVVAVITAAVAVMGQRNPNIRFRIKNIKKD